MKQKLSAADVKKYWKCGGYHGRRSENDVLLNAEETSFGIYAYALENMFGLFDASEEKLADPYLQAQIDTTIEMLNWYVKKHCVNFETNTVTYDNFHFIETFKGLKLPSAEKTFTDPVSLMPYVINYILLQNGYELTDKDRVIKEEYQNNLSYATIKKIGNFVTFESTKKSIEEKKMEHNANKNKEDLER